MATNQLLAQGFTDEQGSLELEVGVGGGMVTVKMNGLKQLTEVRIDGEVMDPDDPAMLADLIMAAVNEAGRQVDDELQKKLGGMTGGLPGLF